MVCLVAWKDGILEKKNEILGFVLLILYILFLGCFSLFYLAAEKTEEQDKEFTSWIYLFIYFSCCFILTMF